VLAEFINCIDEYKLTDVTWLLPFIPHWDIPHFIRACTAICFLERDFPIPIHTPLIPREVFACGTCLVLSHEVAQKQPYRQELRSGENVLLVDPLDIEALAGVLQTILHDPATSRRIGRNGYHDISVGIEDFSAYAQGWPHLFRTIQHDIQQRKSLMSVAEMQACLARLYTEDAYRKLFELAPEASFQGYLLTDEEKQVLLGLDKKLLSYFAASLKMKQQERLRSAYPATFHLLEGPIRRYVNRFFELYPTKPHEDASTRMVDFGTFIEQCLATDDAAPPYASEVAKYERLHYALAYLPTPHDAFALINEQEKSSTRSFHLESIPQLSPQVQMETFTYHIIAIVDSLREQRPLPDLQPGQYVFLFQREPRSLTVNVFFLNPAASQLLMLCNGIHTMSAIIHEAERQLKATNLENEIITTLNAFREKRIVGEKADE
jgi:hypothetical protein